MTRPPLAEAGERGSSWGAALAWTLALVFSTLLGLVLAAAGSTLESDAVDGVAVDGFAGDQASNRNGPSYPPQRELELELRDGSDDSDDERIDAGPGSLPGIAATARIVDALAFASGPRGLAERERAGPSARGPPQA